MILSYPLCRLFHHYVAEVGQAFPCKSGRGTRCWIFYPWIGYRHRTERERFCAQQAVLERRQWSEHNRKTKFNIFFPILTWFLLRATCVRRLLFIRITYFFMLAQLFQLCLFPSRCTSMQHLWKDVTNWWSFLSRSSNWKPMISSFWTSLTGTVVLLSSLFFNGMSSPYLSRWMPHCFHLVGASRQMMAWRPLKSFKHSGTTRRHLQSSLTRETLSQLLRTPSCP